MFMAVMKLMPSGYFHMAQTLPYDPNLFLEMPNMSADIRDFMSI